MTTAWLGLMAAVLLLSGGVGGAAVARSLDGSTWIGAAAGTGVAFLLTGVLLRRSADRG